MTEKVEKRRIPKWVWGVAILSLFGFLGLGMYVYSWEKRDPVLEIHFFSLTRGRAIFIRTPENKSILVGGGQTSETIRQITKVMPFYQRHIDYLIVPSAKPAEIGGLVELIDRYEIGEIVVPKGMGTSTASIALFKKIRVHKIHVVEVEKGDEIEVGDGVRVEVVFPYFPFKFNKTSLPELGMVVSYGSTRAYLMGNLSKTIQKEISKSLDDASHETILEYFHSAGPSKSSPDLLEKIDPKFIFSTNEKTTRVVSRGDTWERIKRRD